MTLPVSVAALSSRYSPPPEPRAVVDAVLSSMVLLVNVAGLSFRYSPPPEPCEVEEAVTT
jgi:hypothetical protein